MVKTCKTKIAALKATTVEARKTDTKVLQAKKINLDGKNILEYISENKTVILDERGILANDELDIWNSSVITDEDGNVIVDITPTSKEHDITTVTDEQLSVLRDCVKVINNEVLDANDNHLMYWQTDGLTIAYGKRKVQTSLPIPPMDTPPIPSMDTNCSIFYVDTTSTTIKCKIEIFNSDLSSLTNGSSMF